MLSEVQRGLSQYRLDRSAEMIEEAKILFDAGRYKGSNNRSYYGVLHAMRAVLALVGFDSKKHSGVIAEFQRRYVKTGVFEREYSKIIMTASEIRNASDYDDYYIASKEEAEQQLENSKKLYSRVCSYIKAKVEESGSELPSGVDSSTHATHK